MDLIQALLEECQSEKIKIFEGEGGMNMRFRFASADLKNRNGRTYPMKVLSKAVTEAQAKIDGGASMLGGFRKNIAK